MGWGGEGRGEKGSNRKEKSITVAAEGFFLGLDSAGRGGRCCAPSIRAARRLENTNKQPATRGNLRPKHLNKSPVPGADAVFRPLQHPSLTQPISSGSRQLHFFGRICSVPCLLGKSCMVQLSCFWDSQEAETRVPFADNGTSNESFGSSLGGLRLSFPSLFHVLLALV